MKDKKGNIIFNVTLKPIGNKLQVIMPDKDGNIAYRTRCINHLENRLTYEKTMLGSQGASDLLKPKARPKQLPICNYRAPEGVIVKAAYKGGADKNIDQVEMTKAEYKEVYSKGTLIVGNSHRVRVISGNHFTNAGYNRQCVFITDSKEHKKPEPGAPGLFRKKRTMCIIKSKN